MASDEIRFTQQLFVYHRSGFKFIKVADIHNCIMLVKGRVIESTLRQSTNQRHLSAFETEPNASTGTRFLALMPFPSPNLIPRTLKISSLRRSDRSAAMVAFTTLA